VVKETATSWWHGSSEWRISERLGRYVQRESNHMKLGRRLRSFSYVKVGRKIGMYGDNMNTPETRE
jgi:hypothetical protein